MKNQFDAIIFDMDGVLVDESKSYRLSIEMTVNYLLEKYQINTRVSKKEVSLLKSVPGFNNDWDVSYALIELLEMRVDRDKFINQVKLIPDDIRKTKKYLGIKDVFQTYYLGEELFQQIYNCLPPFKYKRGLINNEKLLLDMKILKLLARKYRLGVVTSRPRSEALYGLRSLKIIPDFIVEENIIAKEDCSKEKPAPDPILLLMQRMRLINPIYIGDTINDTIAAQKAGIPCIFVGDKNLSDFQVNNINQIKEILI